MSGAVQTASPFLDEPWRRLAWTAPLAVAIWAAVVFAFALVLKQTYPPLPELTPIEAGIVDSGEGLPPLRIRSLPHRLGRSPRSGAKRLSRRGATGSATRRRRGQSGQKVAVLAGRDANDRAVRVLLEVPLRSALRAADAEASGD